MKFILSTFLLLIASVPSFAEDINITADKQVEWHQKSQKIVASGNAIATKGTMNIKSDTLTGYYTGSDEQSKGKIQRVVALGNVRMHSPKADALGDRLDYDIINDTAVLTGRPAKIKTDKEEIAAKENITYYPSKQEAVALGNVEATDKEGNKIYADKMIAYFEKSATSKEGLELRKVNIFGNIKIITPQANVSAEKASYLPNKGLINLYNNVIINQQGNILKGDRAETNLNSGISKLIAKDSKSKVKGVFKEKK